MNVVEGDKVQDKAQDWIREEGHEEEGTGQGKEVEEECGRCLHECQTGWST